MKKLILVTSCAMALGACDHFRGPRGFMGHVGAPGLNGTDGLNSLVAIVGTTTCLNGGHTFLVGLDVDRDGDLSATEVSASAQVCNGLDGEDGQDAPPTPYTPVGLIDPCGDNPTKTDEVLLQLASGELLVSFSDNSSGKNTRFAILSPGNYQTTDGTSCAFSVDVNNDVTW